MNYEILTQVMIMTGVSFWITLLMGLVVWLSWRLYQWRLSRIEGFSEPSIRAIVKTEMLMCRGRRNS